MPSTVPSRIEDIYPLTIVKMRYGGKIVIFNADNDHGFVDRVQGDEEISYDISRWLAANVLCLYGIGDTLGEAFTDYLHRKTLSEA